MENADKITKTTVQLDGAQPKNCDVEPKTVMIMLGFERDRGFANAVYGCLKAGERMPKRSDVTRPKNQGERYVAMVKHGRDPFRPGIADSGVFAFEGFPDGFTNVSLAPYLAGLAERGYELAHFFVQRRANGKVAICVVYAKGPSSLSARQLERVREVLLRVVRRFHGWDNRDEEKRTITVNVPYAPPHDVRVAEHKLGFGDGTFRFRITPVALEQKPALVAAS